MNILTLSSPNSKWVEYNASAELYQLLGEILSYAKRNPDQEIPIPTIPVRKTDFGVHSYMRRWLGLMTVVNQRGINANDLQSILQYSGDLGISFTR